MLRCVLLLILLVAVAAGGPAHAHHSIAGAYDTKRQTTLRGIVTEFRFIRPHAFLLVSIETDSGAEIWQLEMDNHFELVQIGISETTFRPGDHVIVRGHPGRDAPKRLYLRRLDRPADGLRYEQIGYRPSIDP